MKWFHAIGICGKTTSNVAKMFKDMGWFVTGSDLQFFPPVSTQLEKWNIPTVEEYNYKHLTKEFWAEKLGTELPADLPAVPDLCLIVEIATLQNKEYLFAKKQGIDVRPYAQILGEYLIKPESVVVIGTAGKTTTTSLLVRILQELNLDPSYMIGAEVIDIEDSLKNTQSEWSVIEGDEYHSLELSTGAKFLEYKPKYLVITNIGWEHQDIFPTQENYVEEFAKAVQLIPADGLIVAHAGDKNIDSALLGAKAKVIRYELQGGKSDSGFLSQLQKNIKDLFSASTPTSRLWTVKSQGEINQIFDENQKQILQFKTSLLGEYNLENILAAVALLKNIMPDQDFAKVQSVIENFKGPKKRLQILHKSDNFIVIDDFGVAPERAGNSLKTLRQNFPQYKILAVFEPNAGSRITDKNLFDQLYKDAFKDADEVIIPDLSTTNNLLTSEQMVERLAGLGFNTKYIPHDQLASELESYKAKNEKLLVVFFSTYRLTDLAKNFASQ